MSDKQDPDWIPREREESLCPCKSKRSYATCCMPFHYGRAKPATAEQLMRARYSAYFFRRVEYLVETTHPSTRTPQLKKEISKMIHQVSWKFLTILNVSKGTKEDKVGKVEFIAEYYVDGEPYELHERSRFKRHKGNWKYLDGVQG
ncbi:MAG: YchJ family metal-binding protein [Verrucomicrobiota bacterium]